MLPVILLQRKEEGGKSNARHARWQRKCSHVGGTMDDPTACPRLQPRGRPRCKVVHRPSPGSGASPAHEPSAWRLLPFPVHVFHLKECVRPSSGQTREGSPTLTKLQS